MDPNEMLWGAEALTGSTVMTSGGEWGYTIDTIYRKQTNISAF
jgi:hypothetical protein